MPAAGDSLECPVAAVVELDARTNRQIANSARHEHLVGSGQVGDPRPDVDSDACQVGAATLTFPGVDSGAKRQALAPRTCLGR